MATIWDISSLTTGADVCLPGLCTTITIVMVAQRQRPFSATEIMQKLITTTDVKWISAEINFSNRYQAEMHTTSTFIQYLSSVHFSIFQT